MRFAKGAVPTLLLLFFLTGGGEFSWHKERLVHVHFAPAITVDQAAVYASMHEAKIKHYSLLGMTVSVADSGEVAIEYAEAKLDNIPSRRILRDPSKDIAPDELPHRVKSYFFKHQQFLAGKLLDYEEELKHLEEELASYSTPDPRDLEIYEAIKDMTEEDRQEWLNKNVRTVCTIGSGIAPLERQQRSVEAQYNIMKKHLHGLTLVDSTTYLQVARIESMVLRVKPFQFLDQGFPVSKLKWQL